MIAQFEAGWWPSWELFGDTVLVALLLGAVLPSFGVVLVLRQQLFVTAAIGQAANLGVAVVLALGLGASHAGGHAHGETWALLGAVVAAMVATTAALRALSRGAASLEASSVITFLAGASLSIVLLAQQPHGMVEVQRLMLSSLLCVGEGDPWLAAGFGVVALLAALRRPQRLLLWATDPGTARAHGLHVCGYDLAVGCCGGALLGWAMFATGLVFTFACTVLPVLIARELVGSLRAVLALAPAIGAAGAAAGLAVGNRLDLPAGQAGAAVMVVVSLLAATAARALRGLRRRP